MKTLLPLLFLLTPLTAQWSYIPINERANWLIAAVQTQGSHRWGPDGWLSSRGPLTHHHSPRCFDLLPSTQGRARAQIFLPNVIFTINSAAFSEGLSEIDVLVLVRRATPQEAAQSPYVGPTTVWTPWGWWVPGALPWARWRVKPSHWRPKQVNPMVEAVIPANTKGTFWVQPAFRVGANLFLGRAKKVTL